MSLDAAIREMIAAEVEKAEQRLCEKFTTSGNGGWPEWMDVKTAARYLGCEVGAVRKLVERKKVPSHSEGRGCKVWLSRSELDTYMEANRA